MIAHWDDVEAFRVEKGPMAVTLQRLGDAAGTRGVGANRVHRAGPTLDAAALARTIGGDLLRTRR